MSRKSKAYSSSRVICPYYQAETAAMIYCDGVMPGMCFHAAFASAADKKKYKARYCSSWEYEGCIIAAGQERRWGN